MPFHFGKYSLFELNHLATQLNALNFDGESKFVGAYTLLHRDMTLQKAINITYNIQNNNHIDYSPARDVTELAEFYLENDLIPEVKALPDPSYQWVLTHTDYQKLGTEIKNRENGVFISAGYVIMDELDDLYDGTFPMPEPAPHTLALCIGYRNNPYGDKRTTLTLPATQEDFDQLLTYFEVTDLRELSCYGLDSCVPMLDPMDVCMEDMATFNQLAQSLARFREQGTLPIYKALLDAIPVISITTAHQICKFVDQFTLVDDVRDSAEYGKRLCESLMPDELIHCVDTARYGNMIAQENGVSITQYGTLVPKDNVPLLDKIAQDNKPKPMTFGGMSF
ncbi:hypothetical protein RFF05_17855 [Bengtsoniella intestinalis]|uniref:hypothetical protein n=1 Tax=Bengtsoniella intestinalis TaxID=3073143 RepID=UPI00391F8D18